MIITIAARVLKLERVSWRVVGDVSPEGIGKGSRDGDEFGR